MGIADQFKDKAEQLQERARSMKRKGMDRDGGRDQSHEKGERAKRAAKEAMDRARRARRDKDR